MLKSSNEQSRMLRVGGLQEIQMLKAMIYRIPPNKSDKKENRSRFIKANVVQQSAQIEYQTGTAVM